ncbi:hypothetical protein K227x_14260 [Rubripirellula lacrimiformis]|uniref:Uncharacterized protein n=1 Tax=Rubripirellula lacrimiformis TaxID=1930273 RepID=A0A517N7C3_9BACT|nr:hypothetical protein K227x_14260 [Rubripirellula lacrimiformis]
MKCTGGRESRFLVCLHVFRPSPVISNVIWLEITSHVAVSEQRVQEENTMCLNW